jgi:amidase
MAWPSESIMARRGMAGGRAGTSHLLTEDRQGTFHFTMGPYSSPVLQIEPGDQVTVETRDAFGGVIHTEDDLPSARLTMPFVNPQNGPIMVEGAEKGDALAVYIESMAPRGDNPRGTCAMIAEFGALTGTSLTATLNQPLPERVRKVNLDSELVYWSDRVTLPYRTHRHPQHVAGDRFDQLAHAGQPRREHGPARHGSGQRHLPPGPHRGCPAVSRRRARVSG